MTQADLVWHLVELILHKEDELKQVALDQAKETKEPDVQKQHEA